MRASDSETMPLLLVWRISAMSALRFLDAGSSSEEVEFVVLSAIVGGCLSVVDME